MMTRGLKYAVSAFGLLTAFAASSAPAQFYKSAAERIHLGSMSVGATGQFSTILEQQGSDTGNAFYTVGSNTVLYPTTVSNQQQYTTDSVGFLATFGLQPVKAAGFELNYGFTHYSERYTFNYAVDNSSRAASVPTDQHEFTAAYMIRPKHIPFQPFIGIGGGAIDFAPSNASNQWRGAGLLETGFNMRTRNPHLSFRLEGRSLYYRSPNYYQAAISSRSWRVTEQPSISAFYSF